jgi:hypothetical protein
MKVICCSCKKVVTIQIQIFLGDLIAQCPLCKKVAYTTSKYIKRRLNENSLNKVED